MKRNNNLLASHIKLEQNKKIMKKTRKQNKTNMMTKCESKMSAQYKTLLGGTSFVSHNGQSQISLLFSVIQKPNKCKN